jgi:hypothetical protein
MMDTVLFTDHGIVVFAISASAIALFGFGTCSNASDAR